MLLGPSLLQVNGLKGLFIVEAVMRPGPRLFGEKQKYFKRIMCIVLSQRKGWQKKKVTRSHTKC